MTKQQYSLTQYSVESLFAFVKVGEIAIPEIQRPFVWDAVKVRNFVDSLFQGFPVGFLIGWKNPTVKLKNGQSSEGKKILIDGQQRVTALMAALLGMEVVNKNYKKSRITIAFHPIRQQFEVANPAIAKDPSWLYDIATLFHQDTEILDEVSAYCDRNSGATQNQINRSFMAVQKIVHNQIGMIDLNPELSIDTVTEIFIRVNSAGVPLGQADFAMSKIAVDEAHGGNTLRKAIDYFSHMSKAPLFYETVKQDGIFARTPYFNQMSWLKDENDDLYDPSYTNILRVAFASEFKRGRMQDLVALLSGRNFETQQFEEAIVEDSFARLGGGISRFINEAHFKKLIMIIRSAGFIDASMIGSQNALNFAYALYLSLKAQGMPLADIDPHVRRWFAMSLLTGRFSGAADTVIDRDIRQVQGADFPAFAKSVYDSVLPDAFWEATLPQLLNTSAANSAYWRLYQAAQIRQGDKGFLTDEFTVSDLIRFKSDVHHLFPSDFLKKQGLDKSRYNQIANFAVMQSDINIQVGNKEPRVYFGQLRDQIAGGPKKYGNITDPVRMSENFRQNCIPEGMVEMGVEDYPSFLQERQQLMAGKIRTYFASL